MDRKEFLRTLAVGGLATAISFDKNLAVMTRAAESEASGGPDMVAVLGGEPVEMYRKAMEALGGIEQYVKKGQKVVVKPNAAWDRAPELAANTNPDLMAEIVKSCYEAGAKEVSVFDHTCDEWRKAYSSSEIEKKITEVGGKMIPAHEEAYYREVSLPKGKILKKALVHKAILDCDVWLNVPILKVHIATKMTVAMKNYMGIVWDRQFFHRNGLTQCIADICTLDKKPALNIVDAYRLMKSNGPRGRDEGDVVTTKGLFIAKDIVAVDTATTKFLAQVEKMSVDEVEYLAFGEELGLGTTKIETLDIKRIKM